MYNIRPPAADITILLMDYYTTRRPRRLFVLIHPSVYIDSPYVLVHIYSYPRVYLLLALLLYMVM